MARVHPHPGPAPVAEPLPEAPTAPGCVLFIIGRGGGGHRASAHAVRACLQGTPAAWAEAIDMVDVGYLIEGIVLGQPPRTEGFDSDELYNLLMRHGFYRVASLMGPAASILARLRRGRIRRGLAKFWMERRPAVVVSFVPFFNALFRESLREACPGATLVTVATDFDSTTDGHVWIDRWAEEEARRHIIVAGTQGLQERAAALGYPPHHVLCTSGMVVHPAFHAETPTAAEGAGGAARALIFFGGHAPMRAEKIAARLLKAHPRLEVAVLCGGNAQLRERLQRYERCVTEGMLPPERVSEHMRRASFVVGKPGPGVVSEACASGTPFVTERRNAMTQERSVLRWLEETKTGVVVDSLTDLPGDLFARVAACADAAVACGARNRAVFEVTATLRDLMRQAGAAAKDEAEPRADTPAEMW